MNQNIELSKITSFIIATYDAYIKKTCKNTLIDYKRAQSRTAKHDISFIPLIGNEDIEYEEGGYKSAETIEIEMFGYKVNIADGPLAIALNKLSDKSRTALILHIGLKVPLKEIANVLGVSERAAHYYKKTTVDKLKKEMLHENESL